MSNQRIKLKMIYELNSAALWEFGGKKGDIPLETQTVRFKKDIGKLHGIRSTEPEDFPQTYTNINSGREIENPEEALVVDIAKRAKKRKETKRYFSIGDRRKKQQAKHKQNVKIKSGELPPPTQAWRHPDLEKDKIDDNLKRIARRQNKGTSRSVPKWPIMKERKRPAEKK